MRYLYGNYKLEMNCEKFSAVLQRVQDKLMSANTNMSGVKIQIFTDYTANTPVGLHLLGSATEVFGVGYKNSSSDRVWIFPAQNGHALFIDAPASIVTELGFIYDAVTGTVRSPIDNAVVLTNFK